MVQNARLLVPTRGDRHRLPLVVDQDITDSFATALVLAEASDS